MARVRGPTESQEQALLCAWLRFHGVAHFAVPNGARVRPAVARRLKSEGMVAGAPDLVLVDLDHRGRPIAVEMKRERGGTISTAQLEMHARLEAAGWVVIVGRGCQDAIAQLRAVGIGGVAGFDCGRVEA